MMLADIKRYLMERGCAPLADIALHLGSDPDAVRGMLEQWIRKGRVRRRMANAACGTRCRDCDPTSVEIYEWVDTAGTKPAEQIIRFEPRK